MVLFLQSLFGSFSLCYIAEDIDGAIDVIIFVEYRVERRLIPAIVIIERQALSTAGLEHETERSLASACRLAREQFRADLSNDLVSGRSMHGDEGAITTDHHAPQIQ